MFDEAVETVFTADAVRLLDTELVLVVKRLLAENCAVVELVPVVVPTALTTSVTEFTGEAVAVLEMEADDDPVSVIEPTIETAFVIVPITPLGDGEIVAVLVSGPIVAGHADGDGVWERDIVHDTESELLEETVTLEVYEPPDGDHVCVTIAALVKDDVLEPDIE